MLTLVLMPIPVLCAQACRRAPSHPQLALAGLESLSKVSRHTTPHQGKNKIAGGQTTREESGKER